MSDSAANEVASGHAEVTIAEIIAGLEPMGDLTRFRIEDLTAEEEDAFFAVLDHA